MCPSYAETQWREAQSLSTEQKWTGLDLVKVSELGSARVRSVHPLLMSLRSTADGTLFGKSFGAALVAAAPDLCGTVEPERMSGLLEARVRLRNV